MGEVAAIILAAGRATRFAAGKADSKVFANLSGRPLIAHVASAALASRARPVAAVTGHAAEQAATALSGLDVAIVHNADYAAGLSTSLKVGVAALPRDAAGVLVLLGDMPRVRAATLDRLIATFLSDGGPDAVVPLHEGQRGNPVLLGRTLFPDVLRLRGDEGARKLLAAPDRTIVSCETGDPGILLDIDTRGSLAALNEQR